MYVSSNLFRPFCSARCKNSDFGAWASESYSVDADKPLPDPDVDPETGPQPG